MVVPGGEVPAGIWRAKPYGYNLCTVYIHAVDGSEILHQLRLVVYPTIYKVLAPSQVVVWDF